LRIYYHGQKKVQPPAITGHEICGTIVEIGKGVEGYKEGQKAVIVTPVGCGRCKFCRQGMHNLCVDFKAIGYEYPGGFAEYMVVNAKAVAQGNVLIAPDDLPFDEGAIVEPLSCCLNGQEYLNIQIGDTVAIFGAGPIGSMHSQLARSQGATRIILIEPSETRMQIAKENDVADVYIMPPDEDPVERVMEETDGVGVDVAIVACGVHVAQQQALLMTAKRGRVSFFAGLPKDKPTIEFDSNFLHYREISVFGAFASNATHYIKAMALVASRKVDARKLITKRLTLDNMVEGIEGYKDGKDLKMVVMP